MYKEFSTKGKHIIVDAYGVNSELLDNIYYLRKLGRFAIAKSGATFVDSVEKKFSPYGATLLFLLEESHLSFHTFVEDIRSSTNSYISIDLYTCGDIDPEIAIDYIIKELQPTEVHRQYIERGIR